MKANSMHALALATLAVAGGALVGCSQQEDNGVSASVTTELQGLSGAARAAGGDYNKLSEADKQKFIQRAGDEAGARAMVTQMATRPTPPSGTAGTPPAASH